MKIGELLGSIFSVIFLAIAIILYFQKSDLQNQIDTIKRDTVTTIETSYVKPKPINLDTIPAVIVLKKELKRTKKNLEEVKAALDTITNMYNQVIEDTSDSINVPVAVLDTALERELPDGRKTVDSVYTEYHYPPVNKFIGTRLVIGEQPVEVTHERTSTTITESPSLWRRTVEVGEYVAIGGGIYLIVREAIRLLK